MINTFIYRKQENTQTDMDFKNASPYGKVKLGDQFIFWKVSQNWSKFNAESRWRSILEWRMETDSEICCRRYSGLRTTILGERSWARACRYARRSHGGNEQRSDCSIRI